MPDEPKSAIQITLEYIQRDIGEIKSKLDKEYVTKTEFEPIKKLAYGMVSIFLIAIVGAIIGLVIKK